MAELSQAEVDLVRSEHIIRPAINGGFALMSHLGDDYRLVTGFVAFSSQDELTAWLSEAYAKRAVKREISND